MGGDEFAVLALEASEDQADLMMGRLREHLEELNRSSRAPYRLSLSVGMSRFDPQGRPSLDDLLDRAEQDLKREKDEKGPVISP